MKRILLAALATSALPSLAFAQSTTFDFSGVIGIDPDLDQSSITPDTFSGTLTINTTTGQVTGANIVFGVPMGYGFSSVPALTDVLDYAQGPGGAGSHLYTFQVAAAPSQYGLDPWLMDFTLNVNDNSSGVPTLVGYTGGSLANDGLFYDGPQDPWGGCPLNPGYTPTSCGSAATTHSSSGGGSSGGGSSSGGSSSGGSSSGGTHEVPEPASLTLLLLSLGAVRLSRRLRFG